MASLHGILNELGIGMPDGRSSTQTEFPWVIDQPFAPQLGQCYELAFGKLWVREEYRPVVKRIRVDGSEPSEWFDLDENRMLDASLQTYQVKGFRLLDIP